MMGRYPHQNNLKAITLVLAFDDVLLDDGWNGFHDDFISVVSSGVFPQDSFPCLERFTIIAKMYGNSDSLIWQKYDSLRIEVDGCLFRFKFSLDVHTDLSRT